jgi:hypothetical protein
MRRITSSFVALVGALAVAGCGQGPTGAGAKTSTQQKTVPGTSWDVLVSRPVGGSVTVGTTLCDLTSPTVQCDFKSTWATTTITLTAAAFGTNQFSQWGGDAASCGTSPTCVVNRATLDQTVLAIFTGPGISPPPPVAGSTSPGRVYGYVKGADGLGAAGLTVTLNGAPIVSRSNPTTTNANGAYAFEALPGTYTVSVTGNGVYGTASAAAVLPGLNDAGCVKGQYEPLDPALPAGCLKKMGDITVSGNTPQAVTIAVAGSTNPLVGFGTPMTVTCTIPGGETLVSFTQTNAKLSAPIAGNVATFTTLSVPAAIATAGLTPEGRPGFLPINQAQAGTLTYQFTCKSSGGGSASVSVPMVAAVNVGFPTAMRAEGEQPLYRDGCTLPNGAVVPGVTGPMWAYGASEVGAGTAQLNKCDGTLATAKSNPYGDSVGGTVSSYTFRAHDVINVPRGVILITDEAPGAAGYHWKFCKTATDGPAAIAGTGITACAAPTNPNITTKGGGVAGINFTGNSGVLPTFDATTANTTNSWFYVSMEAGVTLYVTNDNMPRKRNNLYGEPNIGIKAANWRGYTYACIGCHDNALVAGQTSFVDGTTVSEVGPQEPVIGWKESKHSKAMNAAGMEVSYNPSCLACHTEGYDKNLSTSSALTDTLGFSSQFRAGTIPDFFFEGSTPDIWVAGLGTTVLTKGPVGNVQCESCHGPAGSYNQDAALDPVQNGSYALAQPGGSGNPNGTLTTFHVTNHTASMNSRVCATCHNGYDDQYGMWASSGHANLTVAQNEGPKFGRDVTHCARCHTAQGYILYLDQLKSGNPDKLGNVTPAGTSGKQGPVLCSDGGGTASKAPGQGDACPTSQKFGLLTTENVDSQSCQTCHDPHSLEVRLKDSDYPNGLLLPGGFTIKNAGSGAICASCHNSRNAIIGALSPNPNNSGAPYSGIAGTVMLHNDSVAMQSRNDVAPTAPNAPFVVQGSGSPHEACQADVYFAGNGYLLGTTTVAALPQNQHAVRGFFNDTCAECHVKRHNAESSTWRYGGPAPSNHTFGVDDTTCTSCHGGSMLPARQTALAAKQAAYFTSLQNVLNGAGITSVLSGVTDPVNAASITKASGGSIVSINFPNHGLVNGQLVKFAPATADYANFAWMNAVAVTVTDANNFTFNDGLTVAANATASKAGNFYPRIDVTGQAITAAAVNSSATLDLTFQTAGLIQGNKTDDLLSGTTPTAFQPKNIDGTTCTTLAATGTCVVREYGKIQKSLYNFYLIFLGDRSSGVHNMPYVDAMLNAMINNLDSPSLPK